MIAARDVIAGFIGTHEGGLSLHPSDNGNWYLAARYAAGDPQARGEGELVGSKFGVTAYALVRYRLAFGMARPSALTVARADMAALTLVTAVTIGVELYLHQPRLDQLAWNRVTASVLDKAWGSGPGRAIRMLQELIDVPADGEIGPRTIKAYAAWIAAHGEEHAAFLWGDKRIAFDQSLVSGPADPDRAFIAGWNNRTRSFLPNTVWWSRAGR